MVDELKPTELIFGKPEDELISDEPSGERVVARCDYLGLSQFSDADEFLFRSFLSPAYHRTVEQVTTWMAAAGMATRIDAAGNLIGRYAGEDDGLPALMIGSHLDSVRDAGRYDGPLGVMLGIECVDALNRAGKRLPYAIEVIAFGDEEGSRFPASMLCSRAVAGTLNELDLNQADAVEVTLADALADVGLDVDNFLEAKRDPEEILAYLEVHIEQGPVLEDRDLPVGTVTAFAGQRRYRINATGKAGHAGTTAMNLRRDAMAAAAEAVLAVEQVGLAGPDHLVATVGTLRPSPGAINVIPGRVEFTLDIRAADAVTRDNAAREIFDCFDVIGEKRNVGFDVTPLQDIAPCPCDPDLMLLLDRAIKGTGVQPMRLVSGAGHDAMSLGEFCPVAMLFVRCVDGISHNPAEQVSTSDVNVALNVMLQFVGEMAAIPDLKIKKRRLASETAAQPNPDGEPLAV